jgi:hypothetical protein
MQSSSKQSVVISFVPVLLGATVGFIALQFFALGERTNFDEIALGAETTSIFPVVDGDPIHGQDFASVTPCLESLTKRGEDRIVLWLGTLNCMRSIRREKGLNQLRLSFFAASTDVSLHFLPSFSLMPTSKSITFSLNTFGTM